MKPVVGFSRYGLLVSETICQRCWWNEGGRCYNDKLIHAGGVTAIPRKVNGDPENGMQITEALWTACDKIPASAKKIVI